jgi:hypothetical protein
MNCEDARNIAILVDAGEADENTAKELSNHLENCVACRLEIEANRKMLELYQKHNLLNVEAKSNDLKKKIFDSKSQMSKKNISYLVKAIASVAAVAVISVITFTSSPDYTNINENQNYKLASTYMDNVLESLNNINSDYNIDTELNSFLASAEKLESTEIQNAELSIIEEDALNIFDEISNDFSATTEI